MLTSTAPVGQRSAHGPQYQHSSTCMNALPVSGLIASESSGQTSTHRRQPSMHSDWSMVTGTSARLFTRATEFSRDRHLVVGACGTAPRPGGRGLEVREVSD